MYSLTNLKAPLNTDFSKLRLLCAKALSLPEKSVISANLVKKSVDARDKRDICFVLSITFDLAPSVPFSGLLAPRGAGLCEIPEEKPAIIRRRLPLPRRPLVVGLGPAGLFAALTLAKAGLDPYVIERGRDVNARKKDVSAFWQSGALDTSSNVQFGEGGAGAFSDGKLNTGIKDARCKAVLETLFEHGAPEEILYQAKPHIGTDRLPGVVRAIREHITALGGMVSFQTALESLKIENGRVVGAVLRLPDGKTRTVDADYILLAVGHSARDTFESLYQSGVPMQAKPFSIGARIEHPQALIDRAQYGALAGHPALGASDYKLSARTKSGRGVYTFCMCPGGHVVAAASENGRVVTNGMSAFARDGKNANSAVLASVEPSDYGDGHPLSGVRFQRFWEERAFAQGGGGYLAPAQRVGDFLRGVPSRDAGDVLPTYRPGVAYTSLEPVLPKFAIDALREGIVLMDQRLRGFAAPGAVLTGVETRSSSPLRILRNAACMSEISGLLPCGEGAGYAGGILSAAVDGIRCAEALLTLEEAHV